MLVPTICVYPFTRFFNAAAHGNSHCLSAISGAQLFHDVLGVGFYCLLGDERPLADLPIPVPAGDVPENTYLALGQGSVAKVLGELRRHLRREMFLARMDLADDSDQLFRRHALEQ